MGKAGIVKRASPDEDEMRADFGFAEQVGSADRTKPPMHPVAAIRRAYEVPRFASDRHIRRQKAYADGSISGRKILTEAAPAQSGGDRFGRRFVSNGTAKTAARYGH